MNYFLFAAMKLIIVNGSPAAGKTTVAKRLHEDLPFSLLVDMDSWRKLINQWAKHRRKTLELAYVFMLGAVDAYLRSGHSVIVDKAILTSDKTIDCLRATGEKHEADIYEIILTANKKTIVNRANKRGYDSGLLASSDVERLWKKAGQLESRRPHAVVIDTSNLSSADVYIRVKEICRFRNKPGRQPQKERL